MIISPYNKPYICPPSEHPRLMVRECDIDRIKKNMTRTECSLSVSVWQDLCKREIKCIGATPDFGTYDLSEYLAVEAKALRALLSKEESDAREAIDDALFLLESSEFDKGIMKARWSGHLIFVCAEVYDWCYAYLTEAEKTRIISKCEEMAARYFEMGYPPEKQAAISGHGSEAQLLRDLLSLGIAVYDERPDIYDFCAGRIIDEYVPAYDFMFAGGFHHQGPTYGSYRYTCLLWSALLFYAMSGEKIFTSKLDDLAESFIYLTRPDGQTMRLGDDTYEYKAPYLRFAPFSVPMFFAAAYTGREEYYRIFKKGYDVEFLLPSKCGIDYYEDGAHGEGLFSSVAHLLFNRLTDAVEERERKPYKYFGYPNGITVWNDRERIVLMKMGELWGSNHDHLDTGCFQIYCGGPLASDSGVYDSYHTPHRMNYTIRTCAHNCLTVSDPQKPLYDEWKDGAAYDGGARRPCAGKEPKTLEAWQENYKMSTVLSHTESDSLCEIVGDMTEAYSYTCNSVIRKMRWEPLKGDCGVLTVEDKVETKSDTMVPAFHIHCQTEPQRVGDSIVINNEGYKLICRVIAPENACVEFIGGEGREFLVDGVNYDTSVKETTEYGWGQIVVTDKAKGTHTAFKVEMEIAKKERS